MNEPNDRLSKLEADAKHFATRSDLANLRASLEKNISNLRASTREEAVRMETRIGKTIMEDIRNEVMTKSDAAALKSELIKWVVLLLGVWAAVLVAAILGGLALLGGGGVG